jgi:hypothetical protein
MPTDAASLLSIMKKRLEMQNNGVIDFVPPITLAMKTLVVELSKIDPSEKIDVVVDNNEKLHRVEYIRVVNDELLAKYEIQKNT